MDMTAWMVSGLMPASIAAVACWWAGRWCRHSSDPAATSAAAAGVTHTADVTASADVPISPGISRASRSGVVPAVLSVGWAVAVSAGLLGQRLVAGEESSLWWPEDFWQRGYWWLFAAALVLGSTAWSSLEANGGRWVIAGLLAMATASASLPGGEGWEDALPLHRGWMLLLGTACLAGFWSLDRLARRGNERWFPLVVLAMLAGPLMVALTTYGALTQWTIAAISATLVCVGFAMGGRLVGGIGIAYPAVAFCTVMVAAGRFYSYEDPPWWSYLGMLLIGPAVSLVDRLVASRSTPLRVTVAASVAILMIAASALWHLGGLQ